MKAFKAMADVISKLPSETRLEILAALEEDFNELNELIEQSRLNNEAASKKVNDAVDYANKRKDPTARHFDRWNMMDSHFNGAYETQMNMQYAIRNMVVECQQALNNSDDAKDGE